MDLVYILKRKNKIKMFKQFDENIRFRSLFLYWLGFFTAGAVLMILTSPFFPSEPVEDFCEPLNLVLLLLAPITETFIFMLIPFWIFKKKGLVIGIIIWVLLHLMNGFQTIFYIAIMGFFYYRCIEVRKIKSVIFFHYLVNIPGLILCLFNIL